MIAVSGAVDQASLKGVLENQFAGLERAALGHATAETRGRRSLDSRRVTIDKPLSQGALGYVVAAPAPGTRDGVAWRLLRYILTHDYSGRLGRSAIMDKGLVYYIANAYPTDGAGGWIKIWAGVDPARADAFDQEFRDQLAILATHPPTAAEVEAAKRNLLGRDISAAQSNLEIAHKLARQFVETGRLQSHAELEQLVNSISAADIAKAVPAFSAGTILRVDVKR
jgi:predicted Zn-dependent peptidase